MNLHTSGIHVPNKVTKTLSLNVVNDRRKVRISSNMISLLGWNKGERLNYTNHKGGILVQRDLFGPTQVHQRGYRLRSNNPQEAVIEFSDQKVIQRGLGVCESFHASMTSDSIFIKGVPNRAASIIRNFRKSRKMTAIAAMTGGMDMLSMQECGFRMEAAIEYRPQHKRDKTNKTEAPALMGLSLAAPRILFNESIYDMDMGQLSELFEKQPLMLAHFSPECKFFTTNIPDWLREEKLNSMDSSLDMFIPCLDAIKVSKPAALVIENVPGFSTDKFGVCAILTLQLRRMGYYVTTTVMNASYQGGLSPRKRCYIIASVFPGYELPKEISLRENLWNIVENHIDDCPDVTHLKSVQKAMGTPRERLITPEKLTSPTILAAQNRGCKDTVRVLNGDRIHDISLGLAAEIMGLKEFPQDLLTKESSFEVLGNGVDMPSHKRLIRSIVDHLEANAGGKPLIRLSNAKYH